MSLRGVVAAVTVAVTAIAGLTPALAATKHRKPKPLKGSWSFTDTTPDPTVSVTGAASGRDPYCRGALPASPVDVNAHTLRVAGRGKLVVAGSNTLDWAMEVRTAAGKTLAGSDGGSPDDQEGLDVDLPRAGRYTVVYCNLTGAPRASATYRFVYR